MRNVKTVIHKIINQLFFLFLFLFVYFVYLSTISLPLPPWLFKIIQKRYYPTFNILYNKTIPKAVPYPLIILSCQPEVNPDLPLTFIV